MPWIEKRAGGGEAWFGGQEGGAAIADVLFGDVQSAGKLPVNVPEGVNDSPASSTYPGKRWEDGIRGRDIHRLPLISITQNVEPLFPFGFGLSYTSSATHSSSLSPDPGMKRTSVTLDVTNTGTRAGAESGSGLCERGACFCSAAPERTQSFFPIALQPGETKTVHLTLGESSFAFFHPMKKQWEVEPGTYTVAVGSSSRDVRLSQSLEIK